MIRKRAKKIGLKRLKRRRKLQKRWNCHGSVEHCRRHINEKKKVEPVASESTWHAHQPLKRLPPQKQTWRDLIIKILTQLRNTIASIFKGKRRESLDRISEGGSDS